ncbi:DMT family transporter [Peribacillus sp. TH16]|uniref:DMT family transporter n=1 Tax=Peribacillus TaxID=2675229 RepID=UPI0019125176|nr:MULTISPECIES: DMT family transporter [unclassified Peribacillus]MBK5442290.1 DMT family transporter [Peribacillus sp. TH24]MBK5462959.1 DMT family transporter [Peribacillus sp. TH27]MBK5483698.1 DMT family transporter [Peribacillus sp. TH16]WMX53889.1 DMT family transporter [Peribacillus sp. R9-11]
MKKTADVSLLFVVFIWGVTFVMVQNALSFLEPFTFNAIRFFMAFVFLFIPYLLTLHKRGKTWNKKLLIAGLHIGVWLFLGYGFQTIGLNYTTPAKTGFITGLSVVMVPVFSLLLLKLRLSRNTVLGVVAATIGLYLMTFADRSNLNVGDFLVFLCAISFAMQIITTARYAKTLPALPLTLIQIFTVSFLSLGSAILFNEDYSVIFKSEVMLQPEVWTALLVTAALATAFAFFAQTFFQAYTTPTRVALIFSMEPVFAAFSSFILIGEKLTSASIIGCVFIFLGMILAELPSKKKKSIATQDFS